MKTSMEKLMAEAVMHLKPLKHEEFICSVCGGIATVNQSGDIIIAECHACGRRATERTY